MLLRIKRIKDYKLMKKKNCKRKIMIKHLESPIKTRLKHRRTKNGYKYPTRRKIRTSLRNVKYKHVINLLGYIHRDSHKVIAQEANQCKQRNNCNSENKLLRY